MFSVRELVPPGQSVGSKSSFSLLQTLHCLQTHVFILTRSFCSLFTIACSSHSQCFAPHFALSHTASFCLAPAVPLLNRRQVRSTWLPPPLALQQASSLYGPAAAPSGARRLLSHWRTGDSPAHQSAQLFDRAARGQPVRGNKS